MKKSELRQIIYQQSQSIKRLEDENKYLRDKFLKTKDFIMESIAGITGGRK